uniref:Uncharacterized protein n=1 Tax=Oryza meridionalis TaxID=40149 RepID=A0A0E0CWU2_9ORYZ
MAVAEDLKLIKLICWIWNKMKRSKQENELSNQDEKDLMGHKMLVEIFSNIVCILEKLSKDKSPTLTID